MKGQPQAHMNTALQLARRGLGQVEPNPMVGAVLVRQGEMIAGGWHDRFGGAHAEAAMLEDARRRGVDPAGCDVYVTLEPCCHQGKTGPCTEALIQAKVARVFVAMADPFSQVAGAGIKALHDAGIEVAVGLCEAEAKQLNEPYLKRIETGLPWAMVKWAQTIDGRIATASGDSKWISNEQSRKYVHQLRARVDAIIVGIGTALADDPALTARDVKIKRFARRVVVDPDLRIAETAKLFQSTAAEVPPVTVAVREGVMERDPEKCARLQTQGIELVGLPTIADSTHLDLTLLLRHLSDHHQASNVLIEGGGKLIGSLIEQQLVDQAIVFIAPKLLGDDAAIAAVGGLSCPTIADAMQLSLHTTRRLGDDVMLDYRVGGGDALHFVSRLL